MVGIFQAWGAPSHPVTATSTRAGRSACPATPRLIPRGDRGPRTRAPSRGQRGKRPPRRTPHRHRTPGLGVTRPVPESHQCPRAAPPNRSCRALGTQRGPSTAPGDPQTPPARLSHTRSFNLCPGPPGWAGVGVSGSHGDHDGIGSTGLPVGWGHISRGDRDTARGAAGSHAETGLMACTAGPWRGARSPAGNGGEKGDGGTRGVTGVRGGGRTHLLQREPGVEQAEAVRGGQGESSLEPLCGESRG